jgi:Putative prokaryotic signal transducing protein
MNPDEAVVVRTYPGDAIASIAASRLGSEGIDAYIRKDDVGGAYPALQMTRGVRLLVKPDDLAAAEKILNEMEAEDLDEVEQNEEPEEQGAEEREGQKREKSGLLLVFGLLLFGLGAWYFLSPELYHRRSYTGVVKRDLNEKGIPGSFGHYVDGQLTRVEEDRNYDGKIDVWYKYVAGKLRTGTFDNDFDGRPDVWVEYKDQFNSVEKVDTDFDGKPDATIFYANGLTLRRDWHPNNSAIIERRQIYKNGVLKEELVDTDRDGNFDLKITYDPFERPIKKTKIP